MLNGGESFSRIQTGKETPRCSTKLKKKASLGVARKLMHGVDGIR